MATGKVLAALHGAKGAVLRSSLEETKDAAL
jgi:hypothetical protein